MEVANDSKQRENQKANQEAREYLCNGGLGEVYGLAGLMQKMGEPKVQMDTSIALALCALAREEVSRISSAASAR